MSYRRGFGFDTNTKFTVKAIRLGRTERPLMFIINVEVYQFIVHCLIPYDTSFFVIFSVEVSWKKMKVVFFYTEALLDVLSIKPLELPIR